MTTAETSRSRSGVGVSGPRLLFTVLGVHLAVSLAHGATHGLVPVALPVWQDALVIGVVFLGPIAGVLATRVDERLGLDVFAGSLTGALLVGVTLHFLVENPDHVHEIARGPWTLPFQVSAVVVALTDALALLVVGWTQKTERLRR